VSRYLGGWAVATLLACALVYRISAFDLRPLPDAASQRWVYAALEAARRHSPLPAATPGARRYRPAGPIFVSVYASGILRARHAAEADLATVIEQASAHFAAEPALAVLPAWLQAQPRALRFRVAVTRAQGRLLALPLLSTFSLVPLRDGLAASHAGQNAYLLPDDLLASGETDHAVAAPVPDLSFGTDLAAAEATLAAALGTSRAELQLTRLRVDPLQPSAAEVSLDRASLLAAAGEGVAFVLRHQEAAGSFTYVYDAQRNRAVPSGVYSLARHAGTMFFLARAARELKLPAARAGALRGLTFLRETALASCGSPEHVCIVQDGRVELGGTALAALACAELLRDGDDPDARELLRGLLAFLRAQQRPDGELMHEYDLQRQQPIDVQHMYYSGEGALALLAGFEQLGDRRDRAAAQRLMGHLTGAGWSFFGSHYYYGEEHWTCQAVAKAAKHMPVRRALDFCLRWAAYQERLQYRADQSPWPIEGAFGVGPVLLPRVTTAASRVEALVPVYRLARASGRDVAGMRAVIERSLRFLMRTRWSPGPDHLFARPSAALGGMPSSAADLRSRVDMVQHAGSAMLAWAEELGSKESP
jgi:hypothetical protein